MARLWLVLIVLGGLLVPGLGAGLGVGLGAAPARGSTCAGLPVLLVHDFAATASSMEPLARRLRGQGRCVATLTYGTYPGGLPLGGMQSLEVSAVELAGAISRHAGAGSLDVVAHGAGSLAVVRALRSAVDAGSPLPVRTLVSLGGLWDGTDVAFLGRLDLLSRSAGTYPWVLALERLLMDRSCASCREVIAHSDFLAALRADGVVIPGVRQVNLVTRYDELVVPYTSGTHPEMENLVLQEQAPPALVEHLGLPLLPAVATLVDAVLRP